MSKKYENFQEFLNEYNEITEDGLDDVVVDMKKETITATTSKLAYRSVHAPRYEITMKFYFSLMKVYAMAHMEDEGDQRSEEDDERPFYGGDCGECEVDDAEHLVGLFEDTDCWVKL
jgi:hypothetical protein